MNWHPDEEPLVNECKWWRRCVIPQSLKIALVGRLDCRLSSGTSFSSSGSEPEIKARPAWDAVVYCYAGAMCPDDLHNDRQA
jgi:hypothetical protein